MSLSKIHRLVKLIGLLQAGRRHNTDSLAQACEVSRRTIFRDLDTLREAGIPLMFDEAHQRYCVPRSHFLPATNFTPQEALSLIVLCHDLGDRRNLPFFGPARDAALKLESSLPSRLRDLVRSTADAVQIRLPPGNPLAGHKPVYEQLLEAISGRMAVRILYNSLAEEQRIRTRVCAYRMLFSRRSWYLIGRSSLHRAVRTFNVGRILELDVLDDGYQIPRGFSTERYLRNAWHLIPEPGPDREVVVRFDKMVAQNVAEVAWHKTQRLEFRPDGSLDFHVTVSGLSEISWWILGYGDRAEALQPLELRRIVARHVATLFRRYQQDVEEWTAGSR
jgi:predicted DNA-binding transcriptional regulator YafY